MLKNNSAQCASFLQEPAPTQHKSCQVFPPFGHHRKLGINRDFLVLSSGMSFHLASQSEDRLLGDAGRFVPTPSGVAGWLRVRCLGAKNLKASEANLFNQWATLDPYALVYIKDAQANKRSPVRCTQPAHKTRHPQWRSEFWFPLPTRPENYVLEIEVYGCTRGMQDERLGHAQLALGSLEYSSSSQNCYALAREVRELALVLGNSSMGHGTVRVEISWQPAPAKQSDSVKALTGVMLNSGTGLRFLSVGFLGTAGLVLLVAQSSRWLCRGNFFRSCKELEVPGIRSGALLAGVSALFSGVTNFLGTAGFFGSSWREGQPFTMLDQVETRHADDIEDETTLSWLPPRPAVQMQVQQAGLLRWDVSLGHLSLFPHVSWPSVRLLTWFTHIMAMFLSALALCLAFLSDGGENRFLGEACYMTIWALICLFAAAVASCREDLRNQSQEKKEVVWEAMAQAEEVGWPFLTGRPRANTWVGADTGGSGDNRGTSGLEDLAHIAQERMRAFQQEAQQLAQPLVAAREDFAHRMRAFQHEWEQLAQPLTEATQRLQTNLEEFRSAQALQPLQDARARIEEHFRPTTAAAEGPGAQSNGVCIPSCPDVTQVGQPAMDRSGRVPSQQSLLRNISPTTPTWSNALAEQAPDCAEGASAEFPVQEGSEAQVRPNGCMRCL
eukprot:TRINITY_DN16554_c0_g1_i1.p1 TRINITY_DN16554_c0_g1~~TRINITY_DN16554_c0_g1_i1.p1  ORF type:complete len:669 (+),score=110.22 TRINITY_DN16554_c0_g1_i1:9-2015(+)